MTDARQRRAAKIIAQARSLLASPQALYEPPARRDAEWQLPPEPEPFEPEPAPRRASIRLRLIGIVELPPRSPRNANLS
jgi:hypothetical protein